MNLKKIVIVGKKIPCSSTIYKVAASRDCCCMVFKKKILNGFYSLPVFQQKNADVRI